MFSGKRWKVAVRGLPNGFVLQYEIFLQVHDIRPSDGFLDDLRVAVCIAKALGEDDGLQEGEMIFFEWEIGMLAGLGRVAAAQDADVFTGGFQLSNRPPCGSGQPVAPNIIIIDDE